MGKNSVAKSRAKRAAAAQVNLDTLIIESSLRDTRTGPHEFLLSTDCLIDCKVYI